MKMFKVERRAFLETFLINTNKRTLLYIVLFALICSYHHWIMIQRRAVDLDRPILSASEMTYIVVVGR